MLDAAASSELSRTLFLLLVVLVAAQRLGELAVARRNERAARARGGLEAGAGHYPVMVTLHTLFLVAAPLEVWLLDRPFLPALSFTMLALLVLASALRLWVVRTLAGRWTTRIIVVPKEPAVKAGPFLFVRHPNYLAVAVEIAALPLVHGAWATALCFSVANGVLLAVRIRAEEAALREHADYEQIFAHAGRDERS